MAVLSPREELREKIRQLVADNPNPDIAADAVVGLFHRVTERYQDLDVTALDSPRQELMRQRTILAEAARDGEPEQIQGFWRVPDLP